MVTLEKKRITIVIDGFGAAEMYTNIVGELLDLLYCKDENFIQQHKTILLLLEYMMPTSGQVKLMLENKGREQTQSQG